MKGLSKGKELKHRQQYGDYQREKGWGEIENRKWGINGDGRRLDLGW